MPSSRARPRDAHGRFVRRVASAGDAPPAQPSPPAAGPAPAARGGDRRPHRSLSADAAVPGDPSTPVRRAFTPFAAGEKPVLRNPFAAAGSEDRGRRGSPSAADGVPDERGDGPEPGERFYTSAPDRMQMTGEQMDAVVGHGGGLDERSDGGTGSARGEERGGHSSSGSGASGQSRRLRDSSGDAAGVGDQQEDGEEEPDRTDDYDEEEVVVVRVVVSVRALVLGSVGFALAAWANCVVVALLWPEWWCGSRDV